MRRTCLWISMVLGLWAAGCGGGGDADDLSATEARISLDEGPRDLATTCGNGICQPRRGESCETCPEDCQECEGPVCGDGYCEPYVEDCGTCPSDCPCWIAGTVCSQRQCVPICGDQYCAPGLEDCGTCPYDCPCWMPGTVCRDRQCVSDDPCVRDPVCCEDPCCGDPCCGDPCCGNRWCCVADDVNGARPVICPL